MTTFTDFEVEGRGEFPMDMLRFGECWPAGPADANAITDSFAEPNVRRTIKLRTAGREEFVTRRWDSFGWTARLPEGGGGLDDGDQSGSHAGSRHRDNHRGRAARTEGGAS